MPIGIVILGEACLGTFGKLNALPHRPCVPCAEEILRRKTAVISVSLGPGTRGLSRPLAEDAGAEVPPCGEPSMEALLAWPSASEAASQDSEEFTLSKNRDGRAAGGGGSGPLALPRCGAFTF